MLITKDIKKAMKEANSVSFHYGLGRDIMRLTENKNDLQYDTELPVEVSIPSGYRSIFVYFPYTDIGNWQALCMMIRPDDKVIFHARVNGNRYTEDSELFVDEFAVNIVRKDKVIVRDMVLASTICPDNTARMLQK
jgi:hypothetical protein